MIETSDNHFVGCAFDLYNQRQGCPSPIIYSEIGTDQIYMYIYFKPKLE